MNDNQDNSTVETEAPDMVNHPPHYTDGPDLGKLECIDITRWLPFTLGNAFKYVWRAGKKGDAAKAVEDLKKAEFYLNDWWGQGPGVSRILYPREAFCAVRALFNRIPRDKYEHDSLLEQYRWSILDSITRGEAGMASDDLLRMRSLFDA